MEYYILLIATSLAINSIFALSLNLQFGLTGVLNFGYIVFVAVGAYITSVTTLGHGAPGFLQTYIVRWDLPWPLPLLAGGLASAALAALVAVVALKDLRSDYQAIAMIAVAQVCGSSLVIAPACLTATRDWRVYRVRLAKPWPLHRR